MSRALFSAISRNSFGVIFPPDRQGPPQRDGWGCVYGLPPVA
jgi:hypothetical protein